MGRIGEWLKKAENLARGHSKQADQLLDKAEQLAKERTGHKYDEQIEKGADAVQHRYGGGAGEQQGPSGEQRPEQGQERQQGQQGQQERRPPQG
ncbi:antitoxin [Nonomuraea sp. K274]|uniref:Antitoxin n=1 Tax=Nonomuraea cypriaca TaxID=1187855 RepID=A0A931EVW1_9ACTN|nr:antitoxin [Nonomuraea cypriaca]MBF8186064.1 antitoxin [Nonomuraea cypriaca]